MFSRFKLLICLLVISTAISCSKSYEERLIGSAERGDSENVLHYLKKGIPVDTKDELGYTALMKAASNGHEDVVNLLIENKASVNAITVFGTTAIMQAAWNGHLKIIKILVDNQGDINLQGVGGWTALYFASLSGKGHPEIVRFLLDKGANPNLKDQIGMTPGQWIEAGIDRPEIVKILHQYGVKK